MIMPEGANEGVMWGDRKKKKARISLNLCKKEKKKRDSGEGKEHLLPLH